MQATPVWGSGFISVRQDHYIFTATKGKLNNKATILLFFLWVYLTSHSRTLDLLQWCLILSLRQKILECRVSQGLSIFAYFIYLATLGLSCSLWNLVP